MWEDGRRNAPGQNNFMISLHFDSKPFLIGLHSWTSMKLLCKHEIGGLAKDIWQDKFISYTTVANEKTSKLVVFDIFATTINLCIFIAMSSNYSIYSR